MNGLPPILNWGMLSNPYNWLVVFLMLAIPMTAITVIRYTIAPPANG